MKKILLVCTGNTCRSSMAEGLLKYMVEDRQLQVKSAGTGVFYTEPANANAVTVMKEMGIDIKSHISQPLDQILVQEADLILTMTRTHKENVRQSFANADEKTYTLKEYMLKLQDLKLYGDQKEIIDLDITDPYGQDIEKYRETAIEIKNVLEKIFNKL
ncbi:low molecular weight protein arginine phosphatase [Alkalibaculum sp. M08DMB]|uniref:Low molecular weight protein arginine phosphatase n=1 Tax=Alkalibaculum sporogenes TaxID=2655001 RepID=A0A6A7KC55_9FIRM|nr:low molecular weight protein arginine phosphatase [Alkalibaculum sporogenes]MPW27014.1 low molecular weight protein arginine phosphatase [Alkalibaculum sporogenes]